MNTWRRINGSRLGFYGPFKNVSHISNRSLRRGGRDEPELPEPSVSRTCLSHICAAGRWEIVSALIRWDTEARSSNVVFLDVTSTLL